MRRPSLATALGACLLAGSAGAQELGTLFHSAEERARLDRLRRGEVIEDGAPVPVKPEITGYVRRSDGRGTVWINGVPLVVADPKARSLLEPGAVRPRGRDVKIEKRPPPAEVKP